MSADNFVGYLELTDKDGNKEYRVSDNVSMSYCLLEPKIDLSVHWQGPMVYRIWHNANVFSDKLEAKVYADLLEESGYYEYGNSYFTLNGDWQDVIKAVDENECPNCHGAGEMNVRGRTISETCSKCKGSGLKKDCNF